MWTGIIKSFLSIQMSCIDVASPMRNASQVVAKLSVTECSDHVSDVSRAELAQRASYIRTHCSYRTRARFANQ